MNILKLLCSLPKLLGGSHRWRRLTKKEREARANFIIPQSPQYRRCRRCGAERIVKARKTNPKPKQETP